MATLQQLEEGIRRAHAAGDGEAVKALGQAYRTLQQQGSGSQGPTYQTPVMQNGQQIGGYTQQEGQPLRLMVDASPEASNNVVDTLGRLGQSAYSSAIGALQGATLGAYDEVASALGTPIKAGERLLTGQDSINGVGDIGNFLGRSYNASRAGQKELTQQAYDQAPAAFIAGDLAGSVGLGGGIAKAGGTLLGAAARPTIMGMAARGAGEGALSGFGTGFNTSASDELIDRLSSGAGAGLAGGVLGGLTGGVLGGIAGRQQTASVPSSSALQDAASDIYTDARASGVAPQNFGSQPLGSPLPSRPGPVTEAVRTGQIDIAPLRTAEFGSLVNRLTGVAKSRNVITPEGNINSTYSALGGPLSLLEEYRRTGRPVTIDELLTIRGNIRDAAANPEQKVSSIGMNMLDEFNDYLYKLAPEIEQADDLYWRGKTGELIDKMGELASARSGQYSQSGMENALRAEARLIERQIIRGTIKGLPPELVEQIKKVSRGDDIQDFARWVSKFGVQNPVTSLTGLGVGLGTGSALPAIGIWGAAQGAGMAARALAFEKYRLASALARNGGRPLPNAAIPSIAAAIPLAAGAQGALVPPAINQAIFGDPRRNQQ